MSKEEERCTMSRKRVIDIGIYRDTEIYEALGDRGIHLYICLWGIAEDSGVYVPDYAAISPYMGVLRFSPDEVEKYIYRIADQSLKGDPVCGAEWEDVSLVEKLLQTSTFQQPDDTEAAAS